MDGFMEINELQGGAWTETGMTAGVEADGDMTGGVTSTLELVTLAE